VGKARILLADDHTLVAEAISDFWNLNLMLSLSSPTGARLSEKPLR